MLRRNNPFPLILIRPNQRPKNRKSATTTHGSHGPSGLDANEARRILTHFGQQLVEISKTLAKIALKISTEILSSGLLEPHNARRLIPFDKKPGVRPIGISEVIRRKVGRNIPKCLKGKTLVLGTGQKCGIDCAFHALRKQKERTASDAVLLIDAKNAFISSNRSLALKNIANICPSLLPAIQNSYLGPSKLSLNKKLFYLEKESHKETHQQWRCTG